MTNVPIIGVTIDNRVYEGYPSYLVTAKYVKTLTDNLNVAPVLLPPLGQDSPLEVWLDTIDGLLLTGSASDIHPTHYGETITNEKSFFDENRDDMTLRIIRRAIERKIPVLGICRGFQEINVALGGKLHQSVHKVDGLNDHREPETDDFNVRYGPKHEIKFAEDGHIFKLVGQKNWMVNSLHDQGIKVLADSLKAEAYALDGLVEAFSLKSDGQFLLATQWHIEWNSNNDACSLSILKDFEKACNNYKIAKKEG